MAPASTAGAIATQRSGDIRRARARSRSWRDRAQRPRNRTIFIDFCDRVLGPDDQDANDVANAQWDVPLRYPAPASRAAEKQCMNAQAATSMFKMKTAVVATSDRKTIYNILCRIQDGSIGDIRGG